jgi:Putative effector of murein hydrolase LrgA
MNLLYQLSIIFIISLIGEMIAFSLPFRFSSSVISMILLFFLLVFKIIKEKDIKLVSDYILNNMAFFFIPSGVLIIEHFEILKNIMLQIIFICIISFILVFFVSSFSVKLVLNLMNKNKEVKP